MARGTYITHICPICNKEFTLLKSKSRKYCSRECYIKSKQTGIDIECKYCGKIFHRRQYHIDRQNSRGQNQFCSIECQNAFKHELHLDKRICEFCGEEFETLKSNPQRFCSVKCQNEWQKTRIGELNPQFTSVSVPCDYCGKEHYVKPYKLKEQDKFFCSKQCRQAWYSEIYSQTDEWKANSRKRIIGFLQSGVIGKTDTKPQKITNALLYDLNINFINEKDFDFFVVDNFLLDNNLIIEVNGDYWHTNPIKFNNRITKMQYDRIGRDKSKHTYIKNKYNIEILYLWENDLINRKDVCQQLILQYIDNNGILDNYHSFNYDIINDNLILKEEIIIPYQDMNVNEYKQILAIT